MIHLDEDALICDFAETYHIYDYRQLQPTRAAVFSCGLRENSRIKMKMTDQVVPLEVTLLAGIADRLSVLVWSNTKDGQKGKNRPKFILDSLSKKTPVEKNEIVFNSSEDFEETRRRLLEG